MMDWLRNAAEETRKGIMAQVARYQNRQFLEATVAGCAMVAAADGSVSAEEKQKMLGFMQVSDELKVFSTNEVIALFKEQMLKFDFDVKIGRAAALKTIAPLAKNPEAARTMVRVCCIIGAADGTFDEDEKRAVSEICGVVGLNPKEFQL